MDSLFRDDFDTALQLLAHAGEYGVVTALSRQCGVSRPTLYAWRDHAQQALLQTFAPASSAVPPGAALERLVLTTFVAAHASARGIQTCLRTLAARGVSLTTITHILQEAEQRAPLDGNLCPAQGVRPGLGRDLCQRPARRLSQRRGCA